MFERPTPSGVRVATPDGAHYALYSFAPGLRVLNGFVQSLVGLYDYASLTGDQRGRALFDAGDATARVEVPRYDTGAWSLYARGTTTRESDLSYHVLLRDFLTQLCRRTADPVYCVGGVPLHDLPRPAAGARPCARCGCARARRRRSASTCPRSPAWG